MAGSLERFSKPNIRFGSRVTGPKNESKIRSTRNRKFRSANRNSVVDTVPAVLPKQEDTQASFSHRLSAYAQEVFFIELGKLLGHIFKGNNSEPLASSVACPCTCTRRLLSWIKSIVRLKRSLLFFFLLSCSRFRSIFRGTGLRHGDKQARGRLSNTLHKTSDVLPLPQECLRLEMKSAGSGSQCRNMWNRTENSIRFQARWTVIFGRFGRNFRKNFRSRTRSRSDTVKPNRNSVC